MVELVALLVLAGVTGASYLLHRSSKTAKAASDLDLVRDALLRLGQAYASRGREAAVDEVMKQLSQDRIVRLANLLGVPRTALPEYRARVLRIWLSKQLYKLIERMEK